MRNLSRRFWIAICGGAVLACGAGGVGVIAVRSARFVKEVTIQPYTVKVAALDSKRLSERQSESLCDRQEACGDSLAAEYAKGFYLLLSIAPSTQARGKSEVCGDIANEALPLGRDGFFERVSGLHFGLDRCVFLELAGGKRIAPATCTFIRSYGLQGGTNEAMVAFSRKELKGAGLTGRLVLTGLGSMRGETCINLPLWRLL